MIMYIILGIVQGLTEFLPVSSSAHLVILQHLLEVGQQRLALTVVLHLGTSLALLVFFFRDILRMIRKIKFLFLIGIVTVVTGIIGLGLKDFLERSFNSLTTVGIALIVTGVMLILSRRFIDGQRQMPDIKDAFILGVTQAIAIVPGISRSGITISTLILRRIEKKISFQFSFVASLPAVLGAGLLEVDKIKTIWNIRPEVLAVGFITSFLSGILSLYILSKAINKTRLHYFGYYCIILAMVVILFLR
ncbi:MAG: undecaprenyl-diphosphate phosphatase [Candidatus Omnitrophica bacterium]|nr:undecaprenyl-diphosphate phosphatase [Candidatus Omnitrophota bacterium]